MKRNRTANGKWLQPLCQHNDSFWFGIYMQSPKNRLEKELLHIPAICSFSKVKNSIVLGVHEYRKASYIHI